jgi:hypothetical protein
VPVSSAVARNVGVAEEVAIVKQIFIGMAIAFAFVTGMALTTIIAQIAS